MDSSEAWIHIAMARCMLKRLTLPWWSLSQHLPRNLPALVSSRCLTQGLAPLVGWLSWKHERYGKLTNSFSQLVAPTGATDGISGVVQ